jgi:hypothetical protein
MRQMARACAKQTQNYMLTRSAFHGLQDARDIWRTCALLRIYLYCALQHYNQITMSCESNTTTCATKLQEI